VGIIDPPARTVRQENYMLHHTWFRVGLIVVIALIALLAIRLHVAAGLG
jgi:hypothetical protein